LSSGTFAIAADDTLAIEVEALSTSSAAGPSQPTFHLNAGTSVAEFIAVDNISAGHERFQFLSALLGPSQPTFDSSASTSAAESIMVDDELADGYEML